VSAALVKKNGTPSGFSVGTRLVFEGTYSEMDMRRFMNFQNINKIREQLLKALSE
jgi:hypothetical protein